MESGYAPCLIGNLLHLVINHSIVRLWWSITSTVTVIESSSTYSIVSCHQENFVLRPDFSCWILQRIVNQSESSVLLKNKPGQPSGSFLAAIAGGYGLTPNCHAESFSLDSRQIDRHRHHSRGRQRENRSRDARHHLESKNSIYQITDLLLVHDTLWIFYHLITPCRSTKVIKQIFKTGVEIPRRERHFRWIESKECCSIRAEIAGWTKTNYLYY